MSPSLTEKSKLFCDIISIFFQKICSSFIKKISVSTEEKWCHKHLILCLFSLFEFLCRLDYSKCSCPHSILWASLMQLKWNFYSKWSFHWKKEFVLKMELILKMEFVLKMELKLDMFVHCTQWNNRDDNSINNINSEWHGNNTCCNKSINLDNSNLCIILLSLCSRFSNYLID